MKLDRAFEKEPLRFRGLIARAGIAIGPAFRFKRTMLFAEDRSLEPREVITELDRFERAVAKARTELEKIRTISEQKVGTQTSAIFDAQIMMVTDPLILGEIRKRIAAELKPAAFILDAELSKHQKMLKSSEDASMIERADDIEDIKQRLLRNLLDKEKWLSRTVEPSIIVAEFLTPADAILFSRANVLGYAIDSGGITSHVAILARSLGIPALVAMHHASEQVQTGDQLILDGNRGELIIRPDAKTAASYKRELKKSTSGEREKPVTTADSEISGVRTSDDRPFRIAMNLEFGSEASIAEAEHESHLVSRDPSPALGIGLVRTEYFLLLNEEFPTEDEQDRLYRDIAMRFRPASVTIRTFDVGGDKILAGSYREENPFLGWRGLRISLDEPEIFLMQLRSMLRASAEGNVRVMFPMVTNLDELERAHAFVEQAKSQLAMSGEPFDDRISTGIMIEVPAAAMLARAFAPLVDFFSVGTNDLTQYTLAVDRGNDLIAGLYQDLHPAVLGLIKMTADAAREFGKSISICGELGSNPLATPVLVGMGVNEISVTPTQVRPLMERIRVLKYIEAEKLTEEILQTCISPDQVKRKIGAFLEERGLTELFSE